MQTDETVPQVAQRYRRFFRSHPPREHRHFLFGDDRFPLKAEVFARVTGAPTLLVGQAILIGLDVKGWSRFDIFALILPILALKLRAAFAAPLILLSQDRQSHRDMADTDADAPPRADLPRRIAEG